MLDTQEGADCVDAQGLPPVVKRQFAERFVAATHTGIGIEPIDTAEAFDAQLDKILYGVFVTHVGFHGDRDTAGFLDLSRCVRDGRRVIDGYDRGASAGSQEASGAADTARGTRDDNSFSEEIFHRIVTLHCVGVRTHRSLVDERRNQSAIRVF